MGHGAAPSSQGYSPTVADDNYRVVLKDDGLEIEIGSIGIQFDGWRWVTDTAIPMRDMEGRGQWQGAQGLHEAVSSGLGQVQRRSRSVD
jgi:hypothetical protein